MNAIQMVGTGQPLALREVSLPVPGPGDVVVEVRAAGICRSDAHYRAGVSPVRTLPMTLGHEVAGVVVAVADDVQSPRLGDRVCLHYLVTCGTCRYCVDGREQFCVQGAMIGKDRDGGFAEAIVVPARNAVPLPDEIPFAHGAVLMCSSATAYHALRLAETGDGDTVAIFGAGGLGLSAIQLARLLGASLVLAVDIVKEKLDQAEAAGAVAIDGAALDPIGEIRRLTGGDGVSVALELAGSPRTTSQAIRSLRPQGKAIIVGINRKPFEIDPYSDLLAREARIIGCSDHLLTELEPLLEMARSGALDLRRAVTRTVPFDAVRVNEVLDELEAGTGHVRTVIETKG